MLRKDHIGYERRLRLDWLDAVAYKAKANLDPKEVRAFLQERLTDLGDDARRKTINLLIGIWLSVPEEIESYRDQALSLMDDCLPEDRIVLHWGMTMASYPFFCDVAVAVGRLLNLQEEITGPQVSRRISEKWGERSTMKRAAQRAIRSMVDWGLLVDGERWGTFKKVDKKRPVDGALSGHLVAGLLYGGDKANYLIGDLHSHPGFFPFDVTVNSHDLRSVKTLSVERYGVDKDLVQLKSL